MSKLNKESARQLSRLCHIDCGEEELDGLLQDLEKILQYIELLDEIDTTDAAPCNHIIEGMANVMREDIVGAVLDRDTFLTNAPSHIGGMIRVPPVIKQN